MRQASIDLHIAKLGREKMLLDQSIGGNPLEPLCIFGCFSPERRSLEGGIVRFVKGLAHTEVLLPAHADDREDIRIVFRRGRWRGCLCNEGTLGGGRLCVFLDGDVALSPSDS